jgi:hypothetical protein
MQNATASAVNNHQGGSLKGYIAKKLVKKAVKKTAKKVVLRKLTGKRKLLGGCGCSRKD